MRRLLQTTLMIASFAFISNSTIAQYCVPPGFIDGPWTNMTNVNLGTLDNSSTYPTGVGADNGYTFYTGVNIPDLMQGQGHSVAITAYDGNIMGMEIRIWIDWDQNQTFDPVTELAATWSTSASGTITHSATISVPAGATLGNTRMRVYCDMPVAGGHIEANPCGYLGSANQVGHHGETEDYTINVIAVNGINEVADESTIEISPNPSKGIVSITSDENIQSIDVYSMTGELLKSFDGNNANINLTETPAGIYLISVKTDTSTIIKRIVID